MQHSYAATCHDCNPQCFKRNRPPDQWSSRIEEQSSTTNPESSPWNHSGVLDIRFRACERRRIFSPDPRCTSQLWPGIQPFIMPWRNQNCKETTETREHCIPTGLQILWRGATQRLSISSLQVVTGRIIIIRPRSYIFIFDWNRWKFLPLEKRLKSTIYALLEVHITH